MSTKDAQYENYSWDLSKVDSIFSQKPEKDGESCVMRHKSTPFGGPLKNSPDGKTFTCWDCFQTGKSKAGAGGKYLGVRQNGMEGGPYVWQTYGEVEQRIKHIGSGILELSGIKPHTEGTVGIYMGNCPEWTITDFAGCAYSYITVPLYETFDSKAIKYIINMVNMQVIVTTRKHLVRLLDIRQDIQCVKTIILVEPSNSAGPNAEAFVEPDEAAEAKAKDIRLISFQDVEKLGKEKLKPVSPATPEELQTICFTSGTTGMPKGAMIANKAWVGGLASVEVRFKGFEAGDAWISYLPLAHCFEKIVTYFMTYVGGCGGYFRGDVAKLFDDIEELKPAFFPTVPRLLNKFYEKTSQAVEKSGTITRWLFWAALEYKKSYLNQGIVLNTTWADSVVFAGIRAKLGGKIKVLVTGSAPIPHDILTWLRCVLGTQVLEGYGQTENCAACSITDYNDVDFPYGSHIGLPSPHAELKLIDVPEMNYFATDKGGPRGELCFRGTSLMKGYYKDEKQTKEAIDDDGWLHSGDIAQFLPDGTVKIIDRRKNIFKLSQGEYIAAEKVENILGKTKHVMQLFIYGDSLRASLVGIVVPDPESLVSWAKASGYTPSAAPRANQRRRSIFEVDTPEGATAIDIHHSSMTPDQTLYVSLCRDPAVAKMILDDMKAVGKANELHSFELPKALYLDSQPFTMEKDLLTPTFKNKRPQLKKFYQTTIDNLYNSLKD